MIVDKAIYSHRIALRFIDKSFQEMVSIIYKWINLYQE